MSRSSSQGQGQGHRNKECTCPAWASTSKSLDLQASFLVRTRTSTSRSWGSRSRHTSITKYIFVGGLPSIERRPGSLMGLILQAGTESRAHWGRCAVRWLLMTAACRPHRGWNIKRSTDVTRSLLTVVSPNNTQRSIHHSSIHHSISLHQARSTSV